MATRKLMATFFKAEMNSENRAKSGNALHGRTSEVIWCQAFGPCKCFHHLSFPRRWPKQGYARISDDLLCSGGHCKKYMGYKLTNKNRPSARHTKSQQFIQHLSCLNLQRFLNLPKHCAQVASPCFWTQFKREMANDGNAKRVVELQLPRRLDIQYLHPP